MKYKLWLSISLVLALLAVVRTGGAQKSYAVGIAGGASIPTGKFSDNQSMGYNGTLFIAVGVPELPIGVRFDGIYNRFSGKTVSQPAGGTARNPDMRVMGLLGNLIYTFPGTAIKPFFVAGGGLYNTKAEVSGAKAERDFGFDAGVGATFGISGLAVFLESRYHSVSRTAAKGGNIQFVPITLGLVF